MASYAHTHSTQAVQIDVNGHKGRSLFSKQKFTTGDVILEETPLVSCQFAWNELYNYRACELCMRSVETAEEMARRLCSNPCLTLPHTECCTIDLVQHTQCVHCGVPYCSDVCRDTAWDKHHSVLCTQKSNSIHPLHKLCETWRNMHYPPETTSIMLIAKMIASIKQSKDHKRLLGAFSQFFNNTVNLEKEIVHKLLGTQFQEPLEVLRSMVTDCLYDERLEQWFTPEGFQSLFALIGTNGQGIGSSSLSVWVKNCETLNLPANEKDELNSFIDRLYDDIDEVSGTFLNCEGSGLYEVQSASNHSCVPNAEIAFAKGDYTLILVALREISEGEEICISYLSECDLSRSRHSRQKILRENYLFVCDCPKCLSQADDEDETSDDDMCDDSGED